MYHRLQMQYDKEDKQPYPKSSFFQQGKEPCLLYTSYAEFASMIPVAGSAYTYSYATMGELIAWIIGWDLVLEYTVAATTVSRWWIVYTEKW